MAITKQIFNVGMVVSADNNGAFAHAVGTQYVRILEDGIEIGGWEKKTEMTLQQVKNQANALTNPAPPDFAANGG